MTNITRTKSLAAGGVTENELAKMKAHTADWIINAIRTDKADYKKVKKAIHNLYETAGLEKPVVILVPSPIVMACAGGLAAGYWGSSEHDAATCDATDDATYAAIRAATYDAICDATRVATCDATCDATDDATRAATYDATRDATYDAAYAAIRAATYDATCDATRAATYAAIRAATDGATYGATCAATDEGWLVDLAKQLGKENYEHLLAEVGNWGQYYQGGNMWSAYDCFLTAARDILGLELPEHKNYAAWEEAAKVGGFRFMHEKFCIVSDFPEILKRDEEGRPHSDNSPSHRWRDGTELYHLHGVKFEKEEWQKVVDGTLTLKEFRELGNAEKCSVALNMLPDILKELNAELVDTGQKGNELYRVSGATLSKALGAKLSRKNYYYLYMRDWSSERHFVQWVENEWGETLSADMATAGMMRDGQNNPLPVEDYLLAQEA